LELEAQERAVGPFVLTFCARTSEPIGGCLSRINSNARITVTLANSKWGTRRLGCRIQVLSSRLQPRAEPAERSLFPRDKRRTTRQLQNVGPRQNSNCALRPTRSSRPRDRPAKIARATPVHALALCVSVGSHGQLKLKKLFQGLPAPCREQRGGFVAAQSRTAWPRLPSRFPRCKVAPLDAQPAGGRSRLAGGVPQTPGQLFRCGQASESGSGQT
jgi:hypothetical protein